MRKEPIQPELQLLLRLQDSDEQALALLMRRYYAELYNYAISLNRDPSLVKDCIQEVFISLWQRRDNATSILSLKYYLLRAVKNRVLKSAHRRIPLANNLALDNGYDFTCEFSIEKMIIEKQLSEEKAVRLKKVITTLSRRQQEIIYLKYYQHLDHGQIAELMNITTQSVYNLLHETIQRLKTVWHAEFV